LDKTAPPVAGYAERSRQAVWNLLSNAIKFTPQGGEVQVDLNRHNGVAQIVVRDTGQGIAPDFLPYIFERFRQADSSSARAHGGLGLGLTIVCHLVELHGGAVEAESAGVGHGAVFTVRLPLTATHDSSVQHDEPAAPVAKPAQQTTMLAGLRVLVVDDEPDALDVLRLTLVRSGVRVMTAATVAAALGDTRAGRTTRPAHLRHRHAQRRWLHTHSRRPRAKPNWVCRACRPLRSQPTRARKTACKRSPPASTHTSPSPSSRPR
jgi:CheY-like chemotaxis protein